MYLAIAISASGLIGLLLGHFFGLAGALAALPISMAIGYVGARLEWRNR
jgi:divalent metal cation (Fe/Co/Zn/Cd) transporter